MRVSFEWLKEYVKIEISAAELAKKMTMAGIAVEEIEDQAAMYRGMVVAKVLSLEKHPQADNLLISKLFTGDHGEKQVITAAKNLKVGDLIPVALPGTTLPNGKTILEANFKGVLSQGMMCSGEELGLEKESAGIWIFDERTETGGVCKPGTPVAEILGATDQVLVLELTANRSDCLGMIGVAREVAAILGTKSHVKDITLKEQGEKIQNLASVAINDPELCPRYTARVVSGVKIGPSPAWMQRRLKAAGVRPISNIVDITNYVMLEYNQPLHAFDYDHIADHKIIVRRAQDKEKLVTLDDVEREMAKDNLLITDPKGALCVAGVMGGCTSEVTDKTVNLLLEAAYFNPISIRKTAKMLEMRTEASLRFERGVDPNGILPALNRAVQLIEELGVGTVAKGYIDEYPAPVKEITVNTTAAKINDLLGINLNTSEIRSYLERVNFDVTEKGDHLEARIPSYRRDVSHSADLAEEVARLHGYDKIPVTIPESKQIGERTSFQQLQSGCRKLLQGIGLTEVMNYSFYSKGIAGKLGLAEDNALSKTVNLMIPLSEEQAVMRTNLVNGLLESLAYNFKRRGTNVAVYEIGRVYLPLNGKTLPDEPLHLGIGLMGLQKGIGWNQPRDEYDFYDLKGIMEVIFNKFRFPKFSLERSTKPFFHPGQSAEIIVNSRPAGFLGQIHPNILGNYELTKPVFIMELDLSVLVSFAQSQILFEPLPKFPAVERDIALVVEKEIAAESIIVKIKEIGGEIVEDVALFDLYQGEQVPQGMRSLAFSITYRSKEKTLNDNEVNQVQERLLKQLHSLYGAVVRA